MVVASLKVEVVEVGEASGEEPVGNCCRGVAVPELEVLMVVKAGDVSALLDIFGLLAVFDVVEEELDSDLLNSERPEREKEVGSLDVDDVRLLLLEVELVEEVEVWRVEADGDVTFLPAIAALVGV